MKTSSQIEQQYPCFWHLGQFPQQVGSSKCSPSSALPILTSVLCPFVEISANNRPDLNMPLFSRSKNQKDKGSDPSDRAVSPNAEELSKISAKVRWVIEPENLVEPELGALDLVSHLANAHHSLKLKFYDLNKERTALEQEKVRLERAIQTNHVEAQIQIAELKKRDENSLIRIDNLTDAYDKQAQLRKKCEEKIEAMELAHANSMADLKARQEDEEGRMREAFKFKVQNLEDTIQSLKKTAENRENDFILEKAQLQNGHRIKQDELKEQFEVHKSKLKQEHNQQQELLQRSIQSRNRALIAREKFSPITDGELKSMFSDLVRKVDALARLKWTLNRSPWTDELQSQMSDTPKRLQKQILQDTIWNALFQTVFCSPFRVFGEEGRVLESQWNKAFGKVKVALATLITTT
jgi:hypothetical protein